MAITQTPLLERMLELAHQRHASDLFLIPGEPPAIRVHAIIERMDHLPVVEERDIRALAENAIGKDRLHEQLTAVGRVNTSVALPPDLAGQLYVASSATRLTVTVRIFPGLIPSAEAIKLPEEVLEELKAERGLIVFTGPIGCGKTTSLLASLDHINATQQRVINTVEDPIASGPLSAKQSLLVQREVGTDLPDLATGITTCLTQDADVIYVGELRCAADVETAIVAADVRSLVLTQLHQPTPATAIRKLLQAAPKERRIAFAEQLAVVLRCIVAQVLLPRRDGRGRVAAYGVMLVDDVARHAIRHLLTPPDQAGRRGSRSLSDDIARLRREGMVDESAADAAMEALKVHASDHRASVDALSPDERRKFDEHLPDRE